MTVGTFQCLRCGSSVTAHRDTDCCSHCVDFGHEEPRLQEHAGTRADNSETLARELVNANLEILRLQNFVEAAAKLIDQATTVHGDLGWAWRTAASRWLGAWRKP